MDQKIKIVRGETSEGIFWIVVFQYGRAEFRCQDIEGWFSEDFGTFIEYNGKDLTFEEIKKVISNFSD